MPTENRSSNTEMVSVPRDLVARVSSAEIGMSAKKDRHQAAFELRNLLASSPSQPHPDPIAWMVGTAFWWTKEEAERDAAATGLPIVGLGPMTGSAPVQQQLGEPVALPERHGLPHREEFESADQYAAALGETNSWNACLDEIAKLGPLYPHADPASLQRSWQAGYDTAWYAKNPAEKRTSVNPSDHAEVERLRAALRFYADREHYHFESGNWDTVSGEPLNILWCGEEPDFIEDGTVARKALSASAEPEAT